MGNGIKKFVNPAETIDAFTAYVNNDTKQEYNEANQQTMDNNRHIILFLDVEYPRFLVVQHPLVNKINGQCVWREFSQDSRETVVEALFREPKEHENCQEHD